MLNQALNVFDFLKIKYPHNMQRKALYFLPIFVGVLLSTVFTLLADQKSYNNFLLSDNSSDLFTLLAILPGFYIAALSAISAINRDAIDAPISGDEAPFLWKQEPNRAELYKQPLTRRVFLTMLFAYLAATSLLLTLALTIIRFLFSVDSPVGIFNPSISSFISVTSSFIFNFVVFSIISQLIVLTLVGVNYLGYKALVDE